MISEFRFTDNVQLNISRYVQVNKYGDCCIYYRPTKHRCIILIGSIRYNALKGGGGRH